MSALALITGAYGVLRPFIILAIKTRQGDIQDSWWRPAAAQAQGPPAPRGWLALLTWQARSPAPHPEAGLPASAAHPVLWAGLPLGVWSTEATTRAPSKGLGVAAVTVHFITICKHLLLLQRAVATPSPASVFS